MDSLFSDSTLLISIGSGIAVFLAILGFLLPYVRPNPMESRMVAVVNQRRDLQAKRLEALQKKSSLRQLRQNQMRLLIERIKLRELMGGEALRQKLIQANWRRPSTVLIFALGRIFTPFIFAGFGFFILFGGTYDMSPIVKWLFIFMAAVAGFYFPNILLKNVIQRRQIAFQRSFPDALDLLTICVESGLSIEDAFGRVAGEMAIVSPVLAQEFELTTAELAYLPERRQAYDNLYARTGLSSVKSVTTSLVQAEKYGTPLAAALRTAAQESREARMALAEKKAASLPAKLTVPMIVFFLPVLFIVILGPAVIQMMQR